MEVHLAATMRSLTQFLGICFFALSAVSQKAPDATTIPFTLDHNRIIIDVDVLSADGKSNRVKAWVDNGDPTLSITARLAARIGLKTAPGEQGMRTGSQAVRIGSQAVRIGSPAIRIGGMTIGMGAVKETELVPDSNTIASGMHVEMNIPSMLLRDYAVVVDYPSRKFTIAHPGKFSFQGEAVPVIVNPQNGLIQIASEIDGGNYNLALDLGTPVAFISKGLLDKWRIAHPSWPYLRGAVGLANLWGIADEPQWELLRIPGIAYRAAYRAEHSANPGVSLKEVVAVAFPQVRLDYFQKRAGVPTIGLMGAASLLNYRIGIDYLHSAVYFQELARAVPPAFDVVGLILRPEVDGAYGVLGVADYKGRPSVPGVEAGDRLLKVNGVKGDGSDHGPVVVFVEWLAREGRILELSRKEKLFTVKTTVRKFL